jgi:four helix bundle protein
MGMALKECGEAKYWLSLIDRAEVLLPGAVVGLLQESDELVAILTRSVITAKARRVG